MVDNNIMALVGAFVGIAILLGISVQILGNSVTDCSGLPGYDSRRAAISTVCAKQCIYNRDPIVNIINSR